MVIYIYRAKAYDIKDEDAVVMNNLPFALPEIKFLAYIEVYNKVHVNVQSTDHGPKLAHWFKA
jgi:hypothetical protein